MTEFDPRPGELWVTDLLPAAEKREDGWYRTDGVRSNAQWHTPIRLVGYTAEYVEKLRAERDADAAARDNAQEYGETVERRKDAWDLIWRNRVRNLQSQRDEAEAEVEKLRAEQALEFAAAPDLVRDLLAEVKRLRSAGYDAFGWQRRCERAEADRDSAVAAVKRAGALADKWADGSSNAMPEECAAELRRALAGEVDE